MLRQPFACPAEESTLTLPARLAIALPEVTLHPLLTGRTHVLGLSPKPAFTHSLESQLRDHLEEAEIHSLIDRLAGRNRAPSRISAGRHKTAASSVSRVTSRTAASFAPLRLIAGADLPLYLAGREEDRVIVEYEGWGVCAAPWPYIRA